MLVQWFGDQAQSVNLCLKYAWLSGKMVVYEYSRLRRIKPIRAQMRRNCPAVRLTIRGVPRGAVIH